MIFWFMGGGPAASRTLGDWVAEVYPCLNSEDAANLIHWTEAELIEWANQGQRDLARRFAMWVERDTANITGIGTTDYVLPTRHLSTIHVTLGGRSLRAVNVRELEALSATWTTDACMGAGTPSRYCQDVSGTTTIRLYKIPNGVEVLAILHHEYPTDLAVATEPDMPSAVADWLFFRMVAEARGKESDGSMPEAAKFCRDVQGIYEQAFAGYWGART
ncbi:MAG: DUF6682 family protein [Planctomycetota bacterium]